MWTRVGQILTFSGSIEVLSGNCDAGQTMDVTIPINDGGTFGAVSDAEGDFNCRTADAGGSIEAVAGGTKVRFLFAGSCPSPDRVKFTFQYDIP